jgi:hypothetical protein
LAHYKKYCKDKEPFHQNNITNPIHLEQNNILDMVEDDFILKLLFCGVAVYAERGLSAKYLRKVEQLASSNNLSFIITDTSFFNDNNKKLTISNIILQDSLVQNLDMN